MTETQAKTENFLLARGGPFYELQRRLGLLREDSLRAGPRAVLFVALAWGIPALLSIVEGHAFGPRAERFYFLDPGAWARFFISVGLFVWMERQVDVRLHVLLRQLVRAPLLATSSFATAAETVNLALRRRDGRLAEVACLMIAAAAGFVTYARLADDMSIRWAVNTSAQLTLAGWWAILVSNTLFWFLLARWMWRIVLWARLLKDLSRLELRLTAAHPDGLGGLAFIGQYPTVFTSFVFALSCVPAGVIATELADGTLELATYGYMMAIWLIMVLLVLLWPLLAFQKPLSALKKQTLLASSAQATRHHRAAERDILGENIVAKADPETDNSSDTPDSSKLYLAARKLSVIAINKDALVPVSAAALIPMIAAGATQLPVRELLNLAKRLILF